MNRLDAWYDKRAQSYSLNWSMALTIIAGCYAFMGFLQFLKYFPRHESFWLFIGPFDALLGAAGIFHGVHAMHAVVRRLVADARQAATH